MGPELWLSVGGLITGSVVQSGPPRGSYHFFAQEPSHVGWVIFSARGSPIQLCVWEPAKGVARPYHIYTRTPLCIEGVGGPRVVVIGHWVGELWLSVTGNEG